MQQQKIQQALNPAYRKIKPNRKDVNALVAELMVLVENIQLADQNNESEEHIKAHLKSFLETTFYKENYINTKDRIDLAIYLGKNAKSNIGVLMEAKRLSNRAEFPSPENLNKKAIQELLLYYLRERIDHKNNNIKQLIATNGVEWFLFKGEDFYAHFFKNKPLVKEYEAFRDGKKDSTNNELFYREIASPFIEKLQQDLPFVYLNLAEMKLHQLSDRKLNNLYKLFSPVHFLGERFGNDSNQLNKAFYNELLHIIGLTETKKGSKKLIERLPPKQRNDGSLLENAMEQIDFRDKLSQFKKPSQLGATREEQSFHLALNLCITWINRILFLKLLEAQLIQYNQDKERFSFLNAQKIENFDELDSLFFQVLAKQPQERLERVQQKYADVPYLNSSLFEPTQHEQQGLFITELDNRREIPMFAKTKLKNAQGKTEKGSMHTLAYLFRFLDAYDFASDGEESIQEENKSLINASVLGLIFEKINGYKDGSFFTPGFITMYMCRETIRKAVMQKFSEAEKQEFSDFDDLKSYCFHYYKKEDKLRFNSLVNSLKICDPAVGSGHFLVSALNELIAVKSELGILVDDNGLPLKVEVNVVNDELVITDEEGDLFEYKIHQPESLRVQKTLFHEKQSLIENSLFGVDINPNSVKICRLRLWIELLKHAYYKPKPSSPASAGSNSNTGAEKVPPLGAEGASLETLPNIDINIKSGNSLISRFDLDADLGKALKDSKWNMGAYRDAVTTYRNARNKDEKRAMMRLIKDIKSNFRSEISANDPKKIRLEKAKGELYNMTQQTDLFEKTKAQQKAWKKKVDALAKKTKKLEAEIQEIKDNKIYENAFEWRFEFPEVLDDKGNFMGFDVVIGNPPYLNVEDLNENVRKYYFENFKTCSGRTDIYIPFIEKHLSTININGQLSFIIPYAFINQNYGERLRQLIVDDYNLNEILDLSEYFVFSEANVKNVIISLRQKKLENFTKIMRSKGEEDFEMNDFIEYTINQNMFKELPSCRFETKPVFNFLNIKQKIEENSYKLEDFCLVAYGARLNHRSKKVPKSNYLFKTDNAERKKYVEGKNIERFYFTQNGWLDYKPNEHYNPMFSELFENDKIMFINVVKDRLRFAYDDKGFYNSHTVINCVKYNYLKTAKHKTAIKAYSNADLELCEKIHLKYLLGILNSNIINWYFVNFQSESLHFYPNDAKNLPIKLPSYDKQQKIESLVNQILTQKEANPNADTSALEAEIDVLVYKLYGLTYEEVLVVDEGFAMSEEEYENLKI